MALVSVPENPGNHKIAFPFRKLAFVAGVEAAAVVDILTVGLISRETDIFDSLASVSERLDHEKQLNKWKKVPNIDLRASGDAKVLVPGDTTSLKPAA